MGKKTKTSHEPRTPLYDEGRYTPRCRCGWKGESVATKGIATRAHQAHVRDAAKANKKKQAAFDISETRIKDVLWRRFQEAMAYATGEWTEDDLNAFMNVCGSDFDVVSELTGDPDVTVGDFIDAFHRTHAVLTGEVVMLQLPINVQDRVKIINNVKESCLSESTKKAILQGLGIGGKGVR